MCQPTLLKQLQEHSVTYHLPTPPADIQYNIAADAAPSGARGRGGRIYAATRHLWEKISRSRLEGAGKEAAKGLGKGKGKVKASETKEKKKQFRDEECGGDNSYEIDFEHDAEGQRSRGRSLRHHDYKDEVAGSSGDGEAGPYLLDEAARLEP